MEGIPRAGRVVPHVFTWIVRGTATLLAFVAAVQAGGGWGAWVIGLSAVTSFVVAACSHARRARLQIRARTRASSWPRFW
jgi:hypothetical protein